MVDRSLIGLQLRKYVCVVEAFQLRLFAKAIGETRGCYVDPAQAVAAGFRAPPIAPIFPACLGTNPDDPLDWATALGADLASILHGSQEFEYFEPICAGDRIRVERRIADIYEKKGGTLEFVVFSMECVNDDTQRLACRATQTLVVRNPAPTQ